MLRTDPASTITTKAIAPPQRPAGERAGADGESKARGPLLSRRKFGPHVAGSVAATVIIGSGSVHAIRFIKSWVQRQSVFSLNPSNVTLTPEPPDWLTDGREKVLALLPELISKEENTASALTIDPNEIARRLLVKMPWVESVKAVRVLHPDRLVLELAYRRPVAALSLVKQGVILLDSHGVVLKSADVRKDYLDNMIQFNYADRLVDQVVQRGGKHPAQLAPGQAWNDVRIAESLALAGFLTEQDLARKRLRRLFRLIDAANVQDNLLVRTSEDLWISWGRPPGQEQPGEPKAETKWRLLMEWLQLHGQSSAIDVNQSMLVFEKDRAVLTSGRS